MKSMPEKEFWNKVRNQLQDYTEEPEDDSWEKIAAAIPVAGRGEVLAGVVLHVASAFAIVCYLWLSLPALWLDPYAGTVNPALSSVKKTDGVLLHRKGALQDEAIRHDDASAEGNKPPDARVIDSAIAAARDNVTTGTEQASRQFRNSSNDQRYSDIHRRSHLTDGVDNRDNGIPKSLATTVPLSHEETTPGTNTVNNTGPSIASQQGMNTESSETKKLPTEDQPLFTSPGTASKIPVLINGDTVQPDMVKRDTLKTKQGIFEKRKPTPNPKRPALYAVFTPSLAFQKVQPVILDDITILELKSPGIFSASRLGFSFETGFQINLTKRLQIYTGVSYYSQQQTVSYTFQSSEDTKIDDNGEAGYTITPVIRQKSFDYHMRNAGISAGIFYHLKGDRILHKLGGGIQYQAGTQKTQTDGTYRNKGSSYFNYQLSYRAEYGFNKKLHFFVQPNFIHAFRVNEKLKEPLGIKPYRAGVAIGALFQF